MSEAKHTPGPWIADYVPELRSTLIGTEDRQIAFARMEQFDGTPNDETQRANARLIAAAPAMYEALKLAELTTSELCVGQDPANACWEILHSIRAALSLAEGK